jgi:hypothetical protein
MAKGRLLAERHGHHSVRPRHGRSFSNLVELLIKNELARQEVKTTPQKADVMQLEFA